MECNNQKATIFMKRRNKMNRKIKKITALLLAGTMLAGCAEQEENMDFIGGIIQRTSEPETPAEPVLKPLAAAVYPEMAAYPDERSYVLDNGDWDSDGFDKAYDAWQSDRNRQREMGEAADYAEKLNSFFRTTAPLLLSAENGENSLYAPANVYMALSLLTEVTDGDSRAQILSLLGASDTAEQRKIAGALWNKSYCADGALTSVIANSLWLRDDADYNMDTLGVLANDYYASSYSGEMGSADYDKALQDWVNSQTGGFLSDSVQGLRLAPETVLALVSTMYYRAKWSDEFNKDSTSADIFHAQSGDVERDFMHMTSSRSYYYTDGFNAITLGLVESGGMWLILPDEGKTVGDVLENDKFYSLLSAPNDFDSTYIQVELSMPKFDVKQNSELSEQLANLGITDVFDSEKADFSPLKDDSDGLFLSQVQHSVRVAADEEGVTAAAFTMMAVCGTAMPPVEKVEFNLNRPFIFVITDRDGVPLFAGTINCP